MELLQGYMNKVNEGLLERNTTLVVLSQDNRTRSDAIYFWVLSKIAL